MQLALIFTLFISVSPAYAKKAPLKYTDELCVCTGEVDTSVMSAEEAKNAMEIAVQSSFDYMPTVWTVFQDQDRKTFPDIVKKDEESFDKALKKSQKMKLPRTDDWKRVQEHFTRDLRLRHHLQEAMSTYLMSEDTQILVKPFEKEAVPQECLTYVDGLKKGGPLEKMWTDLMGAKCDVNASPTQCRAEMDQEKKSPKAKQFMQVQLISFGWHNCVNKAWTKEIKDLQALQTGLKKQISNLKCKCDEP